MGAMTETSTPLIARIVEEIAEQADTEPGSLDPPLAEVVDPDALETLVEGTTASVLEVHFTYNGYDVIVDERGRITVN